MYENEEESNKMDYKKSGDTTFLRVDKGEEVLTSILEVCRQEHILTAWVQGIGACGEVTVSTYLPDKQAFYRSYGNRND